MRLRDKILYMSFGAGLVVLGMVLNSLVSGDADAQEGMKNGYFDRVVCKNIFIADIIDGEVVTKGGFGLDVTGAPMLIMYDNEPQNPTVYLGENPADPKKEMMLQLFSKSKTDKREVSMMIDGNGGRLDCDNKMGEQVAFIGVGNDGGGVVDTRDKFGYRR